MIIDGKSLALQLQSEIKAEIDELGCAPCLAVCLVGDDPASQIYVSNKRKACEKVGIHAITTRFPADTSQNDIIELIKSWNRNSSIHGILVQLPLPDHISRYEVLNSVCPKKDVDGFHSSNIGKIVHKQSYLLPCTPSAVQYILRKHNIKIEGKRIIIINNTIVIGMPLCLMLSQENATVTMCNSYTTNLKEMTSTADIIVSAVGKRPHFILTSDMVKEGSVVIDVGINRIDGKVVGDVDFDNVKNVASWITPVPGSVGPLTISFLLKNTVKACKESLKFK